MILMKPMRPMHVFLLIFSVLILALACSGPKNDSGNTENKEVDSIELYAKQVCSSCHEYVAPDALPRLTWTGLVLPVMAGKMGIYDYEGQEMPTERSDKDIPADYYPEKPIIPYHKFKEIFEFYEKNAPETLPSQSRSVLIGEATTRFNPKFPNLPPDDAPLTTFVKIRPDHSLVLGAGGAHSRIGLFNSKLEPQWVMGIPSAPAYVDFGSGNDWLLTCLGSVMPSNKKEGKLYSMRTSATAPPAKPVELLSVLPRPVQIQRTDMDGNGVQDYLINGFGHLAGKLYWLKNGKQGNEEILKADPGAIKSVLTDWDKDGKTDVVCMFTQGKEEIVWFRNMGGGKYESKQLLGFSPVNGSSSFELVDINKDGLVDIVYTCGDNADYSIALKNFHGVYIYLNKGSDQFEKKYFYPIHGCYKAVVRDFDLDGDLDMATISFFADYITQPQEALVYFENQGSLTFLPFGIKGFDNGRWLTMDAGDLDGDGDDDIVVGNFALGPESFLPAEAPKKFASHPYFMVLENTTK